ncbi:MAG: LPXTG cell wall anchor domain-containing protein [Ruminococcus sp.]
MRKKQKQAVILTAAILLTLPMGSTLTASAATPEDVVAAVENAGWPDWMVQQAANSLSSGSFTSAQCDQMIAQITEYDEAVAKQIQEQLGIQIPDDAGTAPEAKPSQDDTDAGTTDTDTTGNSTDTRPSHADFIHMTLEEKKEYLNSLSEEERQTFLSTMTADERNSMVKQLSAADQAALLSDFMDIGAQFGIFFHIEELTGDDAVIRAYDKDGNLINITTMGISVDPTGNSYTVPVAAGAGLLLLSVGGLFFLIRKNQIKEKP